jgi:hypothetical protein
VEDEQGAREGPPKRVGATPPGRRSAAPEDRPPRAAERVGSAVSHPRRADEVPLSSACAFFFPAQQLRSGFVIRHPFLKICRA